MASVMEELSRSVADTAARVAPAVVGVGAGRRWNHVRWRVVGDIGLAWLVTLPASAALAALALPVWRAVG